MSYISIGAQGGGPETEGVCKAKIPLYHALTKHVTSTHCDAIDEYSLIIRVDGSLQTFGEEGFTRLRIAKTSRYITLDIQIPMNVWQTMSECQLKHYLWSQVKAAISKCVIRLQEDKHHVDEMKLNQLDAAIQE